jgi:hypothetical protein
MAKSSATFQRRNELARQRGYASYGQQRRALTLAKESDLFQRWYDEFYGLDTIRDPAYARAVRTYWEGFHVDPNDYSRTSGKARWFVEYEELMSYEEWEERYPNGVRTYNLR